MLRLPSGVLLSQPLAEDGGCFGIELGRNGNADNWSGDLVEGAFAAGVAARVAAERNIDMPITEAVAAIVDGRLDIVTAIGRLMTRPITQEF